MPHNKSVDFDLGDRIGENISKYRKKKGMSQKDLAKAIQMSRQGLVYYESGRNKFEGVVFLLRISKELGVSVEDLVE